MFASRRHLNLRLFYNPSSRPVKEMLDIWPEVLIFIDLDVFDYPSEETRDVISEEIKDDIVAALRLNHQVSGICFGNVSDSGWEIIAPLMQHPFPVLTHLCVHSCLPFHLNNTIPRSFLSGSAPSLQHLDLAGIPFPELPELLLSSTTNLVRLCYDDIPRSGYISPQAMATGLSALARLESLSLKYPSPDSFPDSPSQTNSPHTRTLLPALTDLRFRGVAGYLDDLAAQIDTPSLEGMDIWLFHQEVLDVSELAKFVRRADKLSLVDQARVAFYSDEVHIALPQKEYDDRKTLMLYLACPESDLRLSYLAEICASCLPTLYPFQVLRIGAEDYPPWEDVVDSPDPQWLDLLCLFSCVKDLRLSGSAPLRVSKILRGLPAERVAEVLPALNNIFISGLKRFGPVREAISGFEDAREHSDHPVSVYYSNGSM